MEFGMKKCAMLIRKSAKMQIREGVELPNQQRIRTLREKENCKYLGILEVDMIKQVEIKENISKEYLKRTRKLFEIKLCN